MTRPIIAVGTNREPKVRAVRRALSELSDRFSGFLGAEPRLETRRVSSGAPSTPRTTVEMMSGARNRAVRALSVLADEGLAVSMGVGLEGGIVSESGVVFLEAWAYVSDGERGSFGSSGCIPLPRALGEAVEAGEDLGLAADRFFGRENVAAREGTFGILTGLVVTREEAFVRSLLHALAPFYNESAYR